MAQNSLSNFSREIPKEPSCDINSKSVHQFSRSRFSIYSPVGHFVQRSGLVLANLVEGKPRNISVKLFQNLYTDLAKEVVFKIHLLVQEKKSFKSFFSIFSSVGHLVQQSGTV